MARLVTTRGADFAELLFASYAELIGDPLVPEGTPDPAAWLYEAPFGLLAHNTDPDPTFVYANLTAQHHFEYTWDEFVGLPSRLSAGEEDREARRVLLDGVRARGYSNDYRGPRVAKSGRRFWIADATVWNLVTDAGLAGQAALIRRWENEA
ncbi:MEKHLA domain-containing protein [Cryptosporangium phraense]|uniref:MEKHLA domain-containing protein n=1 Tax=Cryptosporangium phraense TaxID=2593070 RepID=A0A545AJ75_9ACTN|nr:MEKHLA domain-containing protein [Cryptosporangium phraense]TQS41368.1 MEKHLA domain-containing protein [Cryptosporangium phraense]